MSNEITKIIELSAPVSRIWKALTDHKEFGAWFRVKLDGPFKLGEISTGQMTYAGYEHHPWLATIERMEHERLFAFRWHDFDEKSDRPLSAQPTTLVEFRLEALPTGTRLTITESGFDALPDPRRFEAFRSNTMGWDMQAENIAAYVS